MGEVYGVLIMTTQSVKSVQKSEKSNKFVQKSDLKSRIHCFVDVDPLQIVDFLKSRLIKLKNGDILIANINELTLQIYCCNHQFFVSSISF